MGRKERREIERKIKHLQKTKPWQLQALIRDEYSREVIESRMSNEILAPGDKDMFDLKKIAADPDYEKFKPEYRDYIINHAGDVFTLRKEAKQQGPFGLVSFVEDDNDPPWLWFIGHLKKVNIEHTEGSTNEDNNSRQ